MGEMKLYMVLLGCRPQGRHTEQHDIFFSIGPSLSELVPGMNAFWREAKGNLHIDAWREVTHVDGYKVTVTERDKPSSETIDKDLDLFFINLGGYKENEFEEYHYKVLTVAKTLDEAKNSAKKTAFFKHVSIKSAPSHIDDKFGIDADDLHKLIDILPAAIKEKYSLQISADPDGKPDEIHLAYLPLYKLPKPDTI